MEEAKSESGTTSGETADREGTDWRSPCSLVVSPLLYTPITHLPTLLSHPIPPPITPRYWRSPCYLVVSPFHIHPITHLLTPPSHPIPPPIDLLTTQGTGTYVLRLSVRSLPQHPRPARSDRSPLHPSYLLFGGHRSPSRAFIHEERHGGGH